MSGTQRAPTVHSYHRHLFISKKRGELPLQFSTLVSPPCSLATTLRDLVCVCVCSFYYTERFRSYFDRLPLTILLYVSVFD